MEKHDKKLCDEILELYNKDHTRFYISNLLAIEMDVVKQNIDFGLYNGLIEYK